MLRPLMGLLLFCTISFIPLLLGCSHQDEVVIGAVLVLSKQDGTPLPISESVLRGMNMAIKSINKHGGVEGRKVRLAYRDCAMSPDLAKKAFRELAKQSPVAILSMYSHISKVIAPLATEFKIPQLAFMSTDDTILEGTPYTYRYWPGSKTEARAILGVAKRLQVRKLGIVNIDNSYGNTLTKDLVAGLQEFGIQSRIVRYTKLSPSFEEKLSGLGNCDALQVTCFPEDMIELIAMAKRLLPGKPIIGPNGIPSPHFITNPVFEGVYITVPLIYSPSYQYAIEVGKEYTETTGQPFNQYPAIGYDSINLITQIMSSRGTSSKAVMDSLHASFVYPGLLGDILKKAGKRDFSFTLHPALIRNGKVVYQN